MNSNEDDRDGNDGDDDNHPHKGSDNNCKTAIVMLFRPSLQDS